MRAVIVLLGLTLLSGCGDEGANSAPRLVVINVNISEPNLRVTKSTQATAVGLDQFKERYPLSAIKWSSSTPGVVVNDSGVITVLAMVNEEVVIRAAANGLVGASPIHTFPAPALASLDLSAGPKSVAVGSSIQLIVDGYDQSGDRIATGPLVYEIRSGAAFASVDGNGRIFGLAPGVVSLRVSAGNVVRDQQIAVLP